MQIKKYVADNYSEALASIKQEMGSDALIMTTRSIRDHSEWNGGKASKVEITAAIDSATNNVETGIKVRLQKLLSRCLVLVMNSNQI